MRATCDDHTNAPLNGTVRAPQAWFQRLPGAALATHLLRCCAREADVAVQAPNARDTRAMAVLAEARKYEGRSGAIGSVQWGGLILHGK